MENKGASKQRRVKEISFSAVTTSATVPHSETASGSKSHLNCFGLSPAAGIISSQCFHKSFDIGRLGGEGDYSNLCGCFATSALSF